MVVTEMKPFEEIKNMLKDYNKVLIVGCENCAIICQSGGPNWRYKRTKFDYKCSSCAIVGLSGGKRQIELLVSALKMARKIEGDEINVEERTIPRQCDPEFVDSEFIDWIRDEAAQYDVILSVACGAGVQATAERFRESRILPALNTMFIGIPEERGVWVERCLACGDCILWKTGGICPVARCPKSLINGPCGGSQGGQCEVLKDTPCVWQQIYNRLVKLNQLHFIKEISQPKTRPVHPQKQIRVDLRLKKEPMKGS